ncbi:response regulator [Rufibacter hautae]|uniref:Response regulator n=1 Tax=Rufibacter hautae TaxID=2595005 RepID=A0A5B6TBH3_9BACT|nr:response regulator [Rufibacter hautae]KAA3437508.1 response regulator [Rufibacter hautae]
MEERKATGANPDKLQHIESVMVVDDDDNWIFISKINLKKAGLGKEIITARNGREAIDKLEELAATGEKKLPALIFVDIRMPVMDGFEFLEQISQTGKIDLGQSKVYMCSSSLNPADKERSAKYPIAGFLTKPVTKEVLLNLLA